MSDSPVPDVSIDSSGVFKYILIKVTCTTSEGQSSEKVVVRGYAECAYHADINDEFTTELQKLKKSGQITDWRSKVLGGGRINHDPNTKTILVYGYSQGYGQADHHVTVDILKRKYPDYEITYSNEGY